MVLQFYPMSELRELKSKALFYYIIGAFGNIFTIAFYTAYSYQYYTYTIGLDSLLTSVGIFIGLIFNAVGSPFFGFLSDKKKASKYGKRRLYMLYGLPLYIITGILIWRSESVV